MKSQNLPKLIDALKNPELYPHSVKYIKILQTHISWVILTGSFAYKIKKPLNLGFLDFSALEKRHFYCLEELRLNKRLAQQIYLDVISITGTPQNPTFNGEGPAIEYAVKMKEFRQENQLDRVVARGELHDQHIDGLAQQLADFHQRIEVAREDLPFGSPERIFQPIRENFETISQSITNPIEVQALNHLNEWTIKTHEKLSPYFLQRKQKGFIRECHGDMHLGNMALLGKRVVIFDALEFNENLRWIDVMSEVAFLTMDFEDRKKRSFAYRLLNAYLENTGDYSGLVLIRYFQTYRALVRAKVACIRLKQPGLTRQEKKSIIQEFKTYIGLAKNYTHPPDQWLGITHGLSGSGKTTITQQLLEEIGVIRLRTDIERKRIHGLPLNARTASEINAKIYTPDASRRVYQRINEFAELTRKIGLPLIIDGTFLKRSQRKALQSTARGLNIPFIIFDFQASEDTLHQRIIEREKQGTDASEANLQVLQFQISSQEPFGEEERPFVLTIDSEKKISTAKVIQKLEKQIKDQKE